MKRLRFLSVAFLLLTLTVSAQETFDFSKPQMVDEFGALHFSGIMARLDAAAISLQNLPNLKMYILGYRAKNDATGKLTRNFRFMKGYLTKNRGIDPQRVIVTDQGESENGFGFQIWLAPDGQTPELRIPLSNYLENTSVARKFDEYYYGFEDLEYDYWSDYAGGDNFDEYTALIKKEADSTAYIILYFEYNSYGNENGKPTIRRDSLRKANRVKSDIISKLTKKYKLPLSRIKLVNGGYRDFRQVELWILPKGVAAPAASPNAFPKTQRRSGKR